MISEKIVNAINDQINAEMWSAFLYLSMSVAAREMNWKGASHWFRQQYNEEMEHAFKFMDFLDSVSAPTELKAIASFPTKWDSLLAMFEDALKHEKKVTGMINSLVELAVKEKCHATEIFLQWYVTEQVEEEESVKIIIDRLDLIQKDISAMLFYDMELGER